MTVAEQAKATLEALAVQAARGGCDAYVEFPGWLDGPILFCLPTNEHGTQKVGSDSQQEFPLQTVALGIPC